MIEGCKDHPYYLALLIVWQGLECWLGRTDKIKYGSIPEVIFLGGFALLCWLYVKTKGESHGS